MTDYGAKSRHSLRERTPDIFLLDTRELPWDGSRGAWYARGTVTEWQWSQDVRALGLLRPPWALAHHQLFEASFAD